MNGHASHGRLSVPRLERATQGAADDVDWRSSYLVAIIRLYPADDCPCQRDAPSLRVVYCSTALEVTCPILPQPVFRGGDRRFAKLSSSR